jgi:hypothetical protein
VIPFLSCILLLWYTVQWISNHHNFWVYCAQYHFRYSCFLLLYYIISLKSLLYWGEDQSFFTWTSGLTAVAILQGAMPFMYFQPSSSYSLDQGKTLSLFCLLVIPMWTFWFIVYGTRMWKRYCKNSEIKVCFK